MLKTNFQHILLLSAAILLSVGISLGLIHGTGMHHAGVTLRCVAIVLLALFALQRRSLTPWIFVAMVAGAELGFDAPMLATSLRVFSDIFLRLIKTIVAPLILGTLITGIAAHGQMRSLGRMGLKALIYFEVLTTIAMLIGLAAINITHAGVGLDVEQHAPANITRPAPAAPLRWGEVLVAQLS
jgi:proton glutamate symport protein